jgi:hypothetical protein
MLLLPRPNGIQAQPMGEGRTNTPATPTEWAETGVNSLMWFTGTGVLKSEPLMGILSCEINGRLERRRSVAAPLSFLIRKVLCLRLLFESFESGL